MRIETAMLCNAAEIRDSLLYIEGGVPEWVATSEIGEGRVAPVKIAGALDVPWDRWDEHHDVAVSVLSEVDGEVRQQGGFSVEATRDKSQYTGGGTPLLCPFIRDVPVEVAVVGGYSMTLTTESNELTLRFGVRLVSPS